MVSINAIYAHISPQMKTWESNYKEEKIPKFNSLN
jgi:hypothetical protein